MSPWTEQQAYLGATRPPGESIRRKPSPQPQAGFNAYPNHTSSRSATGPRRNQSYSKKAQVSYEDAYDYALRAAYLAYLLQPRQKRIQHVANTSKPIQRSATSVNEMMKDFSAMRESKSTRFPHGFMSELDKRITGVLMGKEKMPEYNDGLVKRTFGVFLNELKNPTWRKSMESSRKVEDLLLIFFSKATGELQKGKTSDDDSWKLMVDRHVALFVRIISSTLSSNDWSRDRPELTSKLKTLETKLLAHDQDLSVSTGSRSIEVEVPRSYEVRDMPLVIRVCRIFSKATAQAQADINDHKEEWSEQAALRDLKEYQSNLSLNTHVTLSKNDFDLDDSFEAWKKAELHDLTQMMLAIIRSNPELAKSSTAAGVSNTPGYKPPTASQNDDIYRDISKQLAGEGESSFEFGSPPDISGLNLGDVTPVRHSATGSFDAADTSFTFIPPDGRNYYRQVLKAAFSHDLMDEDFAASSTEDGASRLISKQSKDLLDEIALRWRIPAFSRMVLFLDVVREKYQDQQIGTDTVDNALLYAKQPPSPPKKTPGKPQPPAMNLFDRSKWTVQDFALNQTVLSALHDALLRELFELFQHCYENKPPSIGTVMYVLENHIYDDELFNKTPEDLDGFSKSLGDALRNKARAKYHELLSKTVSDDAKQWEFFHVIQLGQAVVGLCEKIQKRYRKNPEVMGVNPLALLVEEILPSFSEDAKALVKRIMQLAKERDEEVPIQDGFDLYKELVQIRQVHSQALQGREFGFHIEGLLQDFVWRWISMTDAKIVDWIEGAVAHDEFQVRQDPKEAEQGLPPTDDERHSQSAADVYRIFNQSVEQIVKLEWDDDLQYAKFMTAMSKSIAKGISRYCELLEGKFIKEMDRQTPEQEARAQQTQKDKWMNYAKDFYQTGGKGEKIEPFQFWPESFIKVNNIEYATLQLDKVEKEINVDACAEVVSRLEPQPPLNARKREGSKYMFTIKIIEAEDLKAGDINGSSDPYVVLGDEYQKRLAKTRTVYQSLNPRWDETIDILTTGPLNVIATVWDWDAIGDHDCLGRTSLKLDPNHFQDFLPREYWLDLDTQGRVLVRVSMEGERDDIQFHFGKAFRTLKRTERDMTRKTTDKLSAYIQQCLSRRTLRALLSQGTVAGVSISQVKGYWSKVSGRPASVQSPQNVQSPTATQADITNSLKPLLNYFDDNFAIMKQTLTESAMITVMTRLWKEVLVQIEGLLVPPLSDKLSAQKSLTQQEVDIVYRWLQVSGVHSQSWNIADVPIRSSSTSSTP